MRSFCTFLLLVFSSFSANADWVLEDAEISARHEAGMVQHKGKLFLIGGRGKRPIDVFNPKSNSWQSSSTVIQQEIHHFQAVSYDQHIYILGAFTGSWPSEKAVEQVIRFNPQKNSIERIHSIPKSRLRGSAGVVVHDKYIYMVGGIQNGHMDGNVAWFDRYDPLTGEWLTLPDAPRARDHFQAAIVGDKLYLTAGRQTSHATGDSISLVQAPTDVYDFNSATWSTLPIEGNIPTPRAGNMVSVIGHELLVAGGESASQKEAHNEVEALNTKTNTWRRLPPMKQGRHGGGLAFIDASLMAVSGCLMAGGEPELATTEQVPVAIINNDRHYYAKRFEAISVDIQGPELQEQGQKNPFTDYAYILEAMHSSGYKQSIRGYFAADGMSQHSSAAEGTVFRAHFVPQLSGEWQLRGHLLAGKDVGIHLGGKNQLGTHISHDFSIIKGFSGQVSVSKQALASNLFTKNGLITNRNGRFYFPHTDTYWLKGGANSPENLLGYHELDGTYRVSKQAREGEASSGDALHYFENHIQDWQYGDPLWSVSGSVKKGAGKGKGLIGAINYLSEQGVNSQYFLTMNIDGDGRDVWPYISHDEFERFDVSKLAQWNMIFEHMQNKDILLHVVTQETENERLLDDGNTGRLRQLYYLELISRFGHHQGLVWNLGEENGPAEWSPVAQNDQQRLDMAAFFKRNDPYSHPILIHSHATVESKDKLLTPLLTSSLNGISFQVEHRENVFSEIAKWRQLSQTQRASAKPWLITMDEIGKWHTGAKVDADDPTHDSLRQHVLWGTLLAGGAGVEWYFGAHQPHNDLTAEDFRTRENLWRMTHIAIDFLSQNTKFWKLEPQLDLSTNGKYVAFVPSELSQIDDKKGSFSQAVVYLPAKQSFELQLHEGSYEIRAINPINGEKLSDWSVKYEQASELRLSGKNVDDSDKLDVVILVSMKS